MVREKILGKELKHFVSFIPDEAEVWVGIGAYQSRCIDILSDVKNNRVIFVNQSYIDDCEEMK